MSSVIVFISRSALALRECDSCCVQATGSGTVGIKVRGDVDQLLIGMEAGEAVVDGEEHTSVSQRAGHGVTNSQAVHQPSPNPDARPLCVGAGVPRCWLP